MPFQRYFKLNLRKLSALIYLVPSYGTFFSFCTILTCIDIMMATGLREELIVTLDVIGSQMPDLTREIWNRLRKGLKSVVLEYGHIRFFFGTLLSKKKKT